MKTIANEIKVVSFNDKEVERQITLNLVRKVAGGMEAAGDVYAPNGEKTGFYRYQSRYEYPVFFNNKGRRLYGGNPINVAIKEVVHAWAASVNAANAAKKIVAMATAPVAEKAPEPTEATPIKETKKEVKRIDVNLNEFSKEELIDVGFSSKQADSILERRKLEGDLSSIKELLAVKGVGHKTIEKVLSILRERA